MVRDTMMWHIWRSWLPLFCIGDCDAKMVAVLVIFTAFLAVLIAAILRMYFNQLVPEGLPVDQHHKLRIVGLITKLTGMVVRLSYYELFNVFVYSKSILYLSSSKLLSRSCDFITISLIYWPTCIPMMPYFAHAGSGFAMGCAFCILDHN